jgi:hypothetical protein
MEFPRHVAPQGKVREKQVLHDFCVVFLFFYFPKVAAHFSKRVPDSSVRSVQFIFEVGVLEKLFYLSADANAFFYLGSRLCLGIFALNSRILRLLYSTHSQTF